MIECTRKRRGASCRPQHGLTLLASGPAIRPVVLPGPRDELNLSPFHELLEPAELRLLPHIQHLVDRVLSLPDLRGGSNIELLQGLDAILQQRLVRLGIERQAPELLDGSSAFGLGPATDLLQRLESREKAGILLVAQLQLVLRLHERVGVEHPLDLRGRHGGRLARSTELRVPSSSAPGTEALSANAPITATAALPMIFVSIDIVTHRGATATALPAATGAAHPASPDVN